MIDGKGLERVFPPLIKNSNLTDKKRLINVVIKGMKGPIKVNGVPYDGVMNGFKFTDQQTSDVINYILNSWGNKSEPVLPTEIQPALKAKIKNYQPILIK
jgi:nitrite reductase (NO-forming)